MNSEDKVSLGGDSLVLKDSRIEAPLCPEAERLDQGFKRRL